MATKNFFVHDGLKVRGDTLLNGSTYTAAPSAKLHIKTAANGTGANLNNVNGLIIENGGSSNTNYALKLATGAGNIFSITNAGRVGIGTTTPNEELTVVGDISASGSIYGNIEDLEFTDLTVSGDLTVGGTTYTSGLSTQTLTATTEIESPEFIGNLRGAVSFKAKAGEALTKGDAVYISGISGNTTVVGKADADDSSKMPAFGIANESVSLNGSVTIINFGAVTSLDTSSYPEGTELYVSTTAGALTSAAPTGESSLLQKIAKVTRQDNAAGSMTVMGAGRTNAVPNLNEGSLFVGNSANQAVSDNTLFIDIANSRVGIGTTDPSKQLQIGGTTIEDTAIKIDSAANANGNKSWLINATQADSLLRIGSENNPTSIVIKGSDGNVGIGITNPDRALHVKPTSDVPAIKVGYDGTQGNGSLIEFDNGYTQKFYVGMSDTYATRDFVIAEVSTGASTDATNPKYVFNGNGDGSFYITDAADNDVRVLLNTNGDSYLSGGNVGIGITNPGANLHVYGAGQQSMFIGSSDGARALLELDGAGNGDGAGGDYAYLAHNADGTFDIKNLQNNSIRLATGSSGTTRMTITSAGNVGVGTASPNQKLEVFGNQRISNSGVLEFFGGTVYPQISRNGTSGGLIIDTAGGGVSNSVPLLSVRENGGTDFVTVLGSGNVGIGITDPDEKLEVDGNIKISAGKFYRMAGNAFQIGIDGSAVGMRFYADSTERMTILSGGNVGIGTTEPGEKLHVAGDIRVGIGGGSYNRIEFTRSNDSVVGGIGWHTDDVFYVAGHPSVGPNAGNIVRIYGFGSDIRLGDSVNGDVLNIDKTTGFVGIGTVTPNAKLDISVDTTSDVVVRISNEDNTTATADAYLHVVTGGLSGGNAFTRYNILGSCNWSTGIDNSDSDKYKLSFSSNLGTNDYITVKQDGKVGINTAAPDYTLDVDGTLRIQNANSSSNYMTFSAPGVWDVVGSRPVIKVGGTEKMRASANGVNIGGSTDATHTLDVDGAASFSSDITIGGNMTVSGDLSVVGAFTYLDTEVTVTSAMDITNTGTGPALVVNQTGEQPVIDIQDDGTSIFYVEDGGNIGLGTTNPDQKLHIFISDTGVTPDANSNLVIEDNDSNNFINVLTNNTAQGGLFFGDSDDSNIAGILYDHTNELLQLRTNNNNNRVTITSGGYVGIGTDSPANKLELNSTDVDVMRIRGGSSARIVFTENTTNRGRIGYGDDGNIFSGVAANSFAIRGENELHLGGDGTLMMTLNSSGVGIGITNHSNIFSIKDEVTYNTTTRLLEITNSGNAGGLNITGNNGRIYMQGYRALEGNTGGSTLTVGETFSSTHIPNNVNMALTDAKLVGVGTSNPQAKLHIAHNSNSNVIIQESVNSASPPQLSFYSSRGTLSTPLTSQVGDSIGSVTYYGMGQSGTFVPGASIDSTVGQVGTNIYSSLDFKTRSSTNFGTRMIITSGGNVGIGITSPTDLLDIHSSTSNLRLLRLSHPTSPGDAAGFLGYNTGNSLANLTFTLGVQYSSTYYNVINIRRDTRNIGLGSLNPENFLELYLNNTTDTGISLRNDTQTWAQIHLKQHVSETHANTLSGHSSIFTTDPTGSDNWPFNTSDGEYGALVLQGRNSTNGGIVLRTGAGGNYRNTLVARENGKVGIDVDDPNEKLTVSGNISASGIIYADAFQSNTGGSSIDLNDDISVDGNIVASGYIESTATSTTSAMVLSYRDQFKKTFTSKITWNHTAAGVQYFNLVFPYTYNQSGYMYDFKFVTDRNSNYVNFGFIRDNSYIYIENDAGSFHRQEGLVQSGGTFTNSITLSGDPSIIRNDVPDATSNGGSFSPNYSYFIVRYPIYFPNATAGTAEAFVHVDVYSQNDDAEVAFLKT